MAMILETSRLQLREFTEGDLPDVAAMMADPDQMSLYPRPRTESESRDWIRRNLILYKERGFGFWLMQATEGKVFLGYCGIRPLDMDGVEQIEMGWHTKKEFWGQGLATEAASACRDFAFNSLGIPRLVAMVDPSNAPSLQVAHKIGMRLEKESVLAGWPCLVYSVENVAH